MDYLPEQDEKEELETDLEFADSSETFGKEESRKRKQSFGNGFLAGILTALFCVMLFLTGWNLAGSRAGKRAQKDHSADGAAVLTQSRTLRRLDEVQSLIEEYYLDEVDGEKLSTWLFKGVAAGLQDPYASYYTKEELASILDSSRGEYTGIGAVIRADVRDGRLTVAEVYPDTPAETAGLQAGDELLMLEDTALDGIDLTELVTWIKGMDGSFRLKIFRPETEEEQTLEIECGEIEVQAVTARMESPGIGYIRIAEFTESAVGQFTEAAETLQEQGMEKLIVDLRENPGGLLDSVCDILDEVLPEKLLVYTEDRNGNREEYHSDRKRTVDCELAVLVNGNSASASEIFAGAVQDHQAGTIIGTTTYGKGVVQKTFPLSDGGAFKMTVEKYYTPLGQDIQGNGITPDIIIEDTDTAQAETGSDPVLEKALEVLR